MSAAQRGPSLHPGDYVVLEGVTYRVLEVGTTIVLCEVDTDKLRRVHISMLSLSPDFEIVSDDGELVHAAQKHASDPGYLYDRLKVMTPGSLQRRTNIGVLECSRQRSRIFDEGLDMVRSVLNSSDPGLRFGDLIDSGPSALTFPAVMHYHRIQRSATRRLVLDRLHYSDVHV